jgi:hypothetical protein
MVPGRDVRASLFTVGVALRGWRPGSRLRRLRASHSYGYVLALLVLTYVVIVAAPDANATRGAVTLTECATLAVALWTSGLGRARPAVILTVIGVSAAVVQLAVGGGTVTGVMALLNVLLLVATVAVIGLGVLDQGEINQQSVLGAVCAYLVVGILFSFVYTAVAVLGSGTFFAQGTNGTPAIRIYFSYVTLTTLGYGDYTAAGQPGRSFAILEALLGQVYLVTVVALLVGRFGQARERGT